MRIIVLLLLALGQALSLLGQAHVVKGLVQDEASSSPIVGVTLSVKASPKGRILSFAITDKQGEFTLKLPQERGDSLRLYVSHLGYGQKVLPLKSEVLRLIKLREESRQLKELVVKAQKITQSKDTISYLVAGFATRKDRTIGDVLANMPGMAVDNNGRVSYNGKPINNVYVEGNNVMEGRYGVVTNNVDHKHIAKVEVLENHQPIKALAKDKLSTETAINLKLTDKAKGIWTANALVAGGTSSHQGAIGEGELFASRFSGKMQTVSTIKANNSGKDVMGELSALSRSELMDMLTGGASALRAKLSTLASASAQGVDSKLLRHNKTYTFSTSNLWKLSEHNQLNAQVVLSEDNNRRDERTAQGYFLGDGILNKLTTERARSRQRRLEAKLRYTSNKPTGYLQEALIYKAGWGRLLTHTGGDFENEGVAHSILHQLENRLSYLSTKGKYSLQLTSVNSYAFAPEDLTLTELNARRQNVRQSEFYSSTGLRAVRYLGAWHLELQAGISGTLYRLKSAYQQEGGASYDNDVRLGYLSGRLSPHLTYERSGVKLSLGVPLRLNSYGGQLSGQRLYPSSRLTFDWDMHTLWKLSARAYWGATPPSPSLFYVQPIMLDYRRLISGVLSTRGAQEYTLSAKLAYANPLPMLFGNLRVSYGSENAMRTREKLLRDGLLHYIYRLGDEITRSWSVGATISKGVDAIRGRVDFSGDYKQSNTPIRQNGLAYDFDSGGLMLRASLRSDIASWMDIDYELSYQDSFLKILQHRSTTKAFLHKGTLSVYPIEDLTIGLKSQYSWVRFPSGDKERFYFADIVASYKYRKMEFSLSLTNLFDQRTYGYTIYGDLSSTSTEYDLRGRSLLLGLRYRF